MTKTTEKFDANKYSVVVQKIAQNGEKLFFAYVRELPNISSYSETYQDAYDDCIYTIKALYEEAKKQNKTFPKPSAPMLPEMPSGRITLRISKSLHNKAVLMAESEGVSLNTLIYEALAEKVFLSKKLQKPSPKTSVVEMAAQSQPQTHL